MVDYYKTKLFAGEVTDDALDSKSPKFLAEQIKTPVLLIHGELDRRVSISQSEDMYRQLARLGHPVIFIELDGESHFLEFQETRTETLTEAARFVNKHIGD